MLILLLILRKFKIFYLKKIKIEGKFDYNISVRVIFKNLIIFIYCVIVCIFFFIVGLYLVEYINII